MINNFYILVFRYSTLNNNSAVATIIIVGKKFLNQTYTSLVLYYKEKDKILVTNIDGPLKHLQNEWRFKEINNQTQLEFWAIFDQTYL